MILLSLLLCGTLVSGDIIPTVAPIPVKARQLKDGDKLLLSQVIWRHGDRAPTMTYPTDEHQENAWPNGWGELTQMGMKQQFALGKVLYNRYINTSKPLLSGRYNSKEIYIRSTDVNRTLVSAYANLAGMFQVGRGGEDYPLTDKWPTGWSPIPVHTIDVDTDYAGNVFAPCPRADELDAQLKSSKEYLAIVEKNKDFLDFLSEKTGMTVTLPTIYLINDVHFIEQLYNMSQPAWLTPDISQRIRNLTLIANGYTYGISKPYMPEMIRLRGGSMLRSVIDMMMLKLDCHKKGNTGKECAWIGPLKYHAYSAHDTTVAAFLTTFGDEQRVIRGGLPKYTASVAMELWDLEGDGPAVRILFHGAFHHNYHPITHLTKGCPEGNEFCPLKTFEKRSIKFMPVNIRKECQKRNRGLQQ